MNSAIKTLALDVTSACDRHCPECCCDIPNRPSIHHSWEYFERAAAIFHGVERVHLCGGEPTLHPKFAEFIPRFKEIFGCQKLSMVTDGWGVVKHAAVIMANLDEVHFTRYGDKPEAEGMLEAMARKGMDVKVFDAGEGMGNFTPRSQRGPGGPCHRAWWLSGQVAYADGRVFGCCVAPGIAGAASVLPIVGERFDVPNPPCEKCWFSE